MSEGVNRYAKAAPIVDLIWERAQGYPELLNQITTYSDAEWTEIAVQAGVSDGRYTPSQKTRDLVVTLLIDRVKRPDPFDGL